MNFAYTARDSSGAAVSGNLAAASAVEVTQMLRAEGKYPITVTGADESSPERSRAISRRGIRISRKDLIQISMQLAIMVETGVTLPEALDCIAGQSEKPNVKKLMEDLSQQVQGGSDFSTALKRHPRAFPRLYVALMSASEKSGMMSKLMHRATSYLRDEQDTLRRVRGALTYPAIMLLFAIGTTTFLLAFVMPKFTAIYAAKAAALPAPTKFLMATSDFVVHEWIWLVGGIAAVTIGGYFYIRTAGGARVFHWVQLHTPLLGGMYKKLHFSRGLRMIGTMASSGLHLVDCVKTAHDLCPNSYYRDLWNEVSEQIQAGKQFSEPLFANPLVPRAIAQMLSSAEKSGKLAQVMEQVSGFAEAELKEKIAEMTRYIEPIMITIMGAIIGTVALALMLPIFTISKVIAK
jgi:type IV pilus assembly protein PilC